MLKHIKSIALAGFIVFIVVLGFSFASTLNEKLSCFLGSCEKEMAATIAEQKKIIEQLQKDLKTSQDELKLIKGNQQDNAEALRDLCEKKSEISERGRSILDDVLQVSKAPKVSQSKTTPREEFIDGVEIIHEPSEPLILKAEPEKSIYDHQAIGNVAPEKIIDGLWSMYCEGNKDVCKKAD